VLDIFLRRHRDTEAAKTLLTRPLGAYDVPEVIRTDQLRSYGAAIRGIPSLVNVDHQQVISTARCNNVIEQRAGPIQEAWRPHGEEWPHTGVRSRRGGRPTQDKNTNLHGDKSEVSRGSGDRNALKRS